MTRNHEQEDEHEHEHERENKGIVNSGFVRCLVSRDT